MDRILDWSPVLDILKEFNFKFVNEPDMYWYRFDLMTPDHQYRIEAKRNHIILYHLDEHGEIYKGEDQEPFQFILNEPNDLRIILNTLIT